MCALPILLATNVYFYVKYKSTDDKVYELTEEKVSMEAEIDSIEAELDRLIDDNVKLSAALKSAQDSVRSTIATLRRSEERRVGKAWVSTCSYRRARDDYKKKEDE